MIVKYHGASDRDSPLVRFEMAEIEAAIEVDNLQKSLSWKVLFSTRGNRHRSFLVGILGFIMQWQGNGLVSYYLKLVLTSAGITDAKTQLEINGGTQIWAFVSALFAAQFVELAGRRRMFLAALSGTALSYVIWTILSALAAEGGYKNKGLGYGVVAMIFVFQGFYHIAGPIAPVYVQECSTYETRAKANILYGLTTTGASVFNSFTNPVALGKIGWKYYIVYCCLDVVWIFVIFFTFPETRGLSLEEISLIFDGSEATGHQAAAEAEFIGKTDVTHVEDVAVIPGKQV